MARLRGRVKWFNDSKGFGFIQLENHKDVFAHYTQIVGDGFKALADGQEVEFELSEDHHGPLALKIVPIQSSAS